jgi:hypothetical protein
VENKQIDDFSQQIFGCSIDAASSLLPIERILDFLSYPCGATLEESAQIFKEVITMETRDSGAALVSIQCISDF